MIAIPQSLQAETDANGAPLLYRHVGIAYDEYGYFEREGAPQSQDAAPEECRVSMYSHYVKYEVGGATFGATLLGSANADRLRSDLGSSSQEVFSLSNHAPLQLENHPVFVNGAFVGRELRLGFWTQPTHSLYTEQLSILKWIGGRVREYEIWIIGHAPSPAPTRKFTQRKREATLQRLNDPWEKPGYYLFARCRFEGPTA